MCLRPVASFTCVHACTSPVQERHHDAIHVLKKFVTEPYFPNPNAVHARAYVTLAQAQILTGQR
jgi:hypothetical protein